MVTTMDVQSISMHRTYMDRLHIASINSKCLTLQHEENGKSASSKFLFQHSQFCQYPDVSGGYNLQNRNKWGGGCSVLGDSKCLVWQLTFFRLVSASICTQISSTCICCMSMVRKVTDDM